MSTQYPRKSFGVYGDVDLSNECSEMEQFSSVQRLFKAAFQVGLVLGRNDVAPDPGMCARFWGNIRLKRRTLRSGRSVGNGLVGSDPIDWQWPLKGTCRLH